MWSGVGGVVSGYTVRVSSEEGRGGTSDFSSKATSFTVESAAVGGYRRVSIRVVAVNDAGYGIESEAVEERTPLIGREEGEGRGVDRKQINVVGYKKKYHLVKRYFFVTRQNSEDVIKQVNSFYYLISDYSPFPTLLCGIEPWRASSSSQAMPLSNGLCFKCERERLIAISS